MSPQRRSIVYGIAACIVGAHALCFLVQRDPWPFSNYSMYSRPWGNPWTNLELVGVSREDANREVRFRIEGAFGTSPRCARTTYGLSKLVARARRGALSAERLGAVAAQIARLYETQRRWGSASIEPIQGVRVYRQVWRKRRNEPGAGWSMTERSLVAEGLIGEDSE